MNPVHPSTRAITRREALLLLGAGTAAAAALGGCHGAANSASGQRFIRFKLPTTRVVIAQGGYGMLQAQNDPGFFNVFLDYENERQENTLPATVTDRHTSPSRADLTRYLRASHTAVVGRYACKYRAISLPEAVFNVAFNSKFPVEETVTDTTDSGILDFELVIIPAGARVALTVNRIGEATAVNPGSSVMFRVLVFATQSLSFIDEGAEGAVEGTNSESGVGPVNQTGISGTVTFAVSGLPTGVSAAFGPDAVTMQSGGEAEANLTFTVAAGTTAGAVNFSVTALHGDPAQSVGTATGTFIIGGSDTPPPVTPTPTPPPPATGSLVFSDVTAPIFSEPITGEGYWYRENDGANLFSEVNDVRTAGVHELTQRVVRVRVGSPSGSLIGGTFPLINPPLTAGAQLNILQSGSHVQGAPNYLTYQSTPGIGSIRTEFLPGSTTKIRVTIIDSLEMLPDGVAINSTGSFRLSGTLVMEFSGSSGTRSQLEKHSPLYSQVV